MIRAGLYARRSTEEHQAASIETQVEEARAFIHRRGWTLCDQHIYIDGNHGRAEFVNRPALTSLLQAAERGEFDHVVARDETRLGGDMLRTTELLQRLSDYGCTVFYYFNDELVCMDTATDRLTTLLRNFGAEVEREKLAGRTHEALLVKARRGHVVGGRVFGYDNVRVGDHVEYRVNEEQAAVVKEIFKRRADGEGYRAIAKALNAAGTPAPRAGRRGSGSWSFSAVRGILYNQRYTGVLVWNRTNQGVYRAGTKVHEARPPEQHVEHFNAELQIISDLLWGAAHAQDHHPAGPRRAAPGRRPRYLLSGFSRCGVCGGTIAVNNHKIGGTKVKAYGCGWHRDRGAAVCGNSLRRPVDAVDADVLGWLMENVITEQIIQASFAKLRERLDAHDAHRSTEVPALQARAADLQAELDRLVQALLRTNEQPESVMRAISEREDKLAAVQAEIDAYGTNRKVLDLEARRLEQEARRRLKDFQGIVRRNPEQARKVIAAVVTAKLVWTPITTSAGRRYRITGEADPCGVVGELGSVKLASPTGFEPVLQP